jgi:hypothetical protein
MVFALFALYITVDHLISSGYIPKLSKVLLYLTSNRSEYWWLTTAAATDGLGV